MEYTEAKSKRISEALANVPTGEDLFADVPRLSTWINKAIGKAEGKFIFFKKQLFTLF